MVGKKVRVLHNYFDLVKDKIYTVRVEDGSFYFLEELNEMFFKTRFETVYVSAPECQPTIKMEEEERLRAILTAPRDGECKCGLLKISCEYHR